MSNDIAKTLELIKVVRKYPFIYCQKTPYGYRDRTTNEQTWRQISAEINVDVKLCRKKWSCLRNSYAREIQLKAKGKKSAWYLDKYMNFLKPYMDRSNANNSNIAIDTTDNITSNEAAQVGSENVPAATTNEETSASVSTLASQPLPDDNVTVMYYISASESGDDNDSMNNTASTASVKNVEPSAEEACTTIASSVVRVDTDELEDSNIKFFQSLLPDMRKLASRKQRYFKHDVLVCLNSLLNQQEDD